MEQVPVTGRSSSVRIRGVRVLVPKERECIQKIVFEGFRHADVWVHLFFHFVTTPYGFPGSQERKPAESSGFLRTEPKPEALV
jgi:hypothetical protein